MQLTPIATNQTQLNLNDGTEIFFSYKTPVAAKLPNYDYIRTATKWSTTTTRHINKWLEGVIATEVSQDILDNLVASQSLGFLLQTVPPLFYYETTKVHSTKFNQSKER